MLCYRHAKTYIQSFSWSFQFISVVFFWHFSLFSLFPFKSLFFSFLTTQRLPTNLKRKREKEREKTFDINTNDYVFCLWVFSNSYLFLNFLASLCLKALNIHHFCISLRCEIFGPFRVNILFFFFSFLFIQVFFFCWSHRLLLLKSTSKSKWLIEK